MIKITYPDGLTVNVLATKFPDGQPHIKVPVIVSSTPGEFLVQCRIRNPDELFELMLLDNVLGAQRISYTLQIMYLMGGRMDRRIDNTQPYTLEVIEQMMDYRAHKIQIVDAHSDVSLRLFKAENMLPFTQVNEIVSSLGDDIVIVCPDKGAVERVTKLANGLPIAFCEKTRDPQTGKLSGFTLLQPNRVKGKRCLILDDIADGGGTFVGTAKELRAAGATEVNLFVTHGIFSKGVPLEGIDKIWTTNSYKDEYPEGITVLKVW